MNSDGASVTVRIAGEEYIIRANTEPAYTKKCAKLVDDRINEIRLQSGLIEAQKAAILAALSIADDCLQAEARNEEVEEETSQQLKNLARRIQEAVPNR